ncbi:hypothetical protein JM16_009328 [Phytophthora kernoviae]|uniref:Probable pectate lyase F n=1 Tax=Phytophthora kernoviae TaxID=325452 RepID=A0A8T0LLF9_9STRA|nr:hypothetical protein JM16_009328 [Phytophthora kernoviae]
MAQYTNNDGATQQQSTEAPGSSWDKGTDDKSTEAPKSSDDNNDNDDSGNSWTQAPVTSWGNSGELDDDSTVVPTTSSDSNSNTWTQALDSSGESNGEDNGDDENSSSKSGGNSWTQPPATSRESSGNSDDDKSSQTNENSGDATFENSKNPWEQGPVTSSDSSQTTDGDSTETPAASSTGSQTSGGGSTTPSMSSGSVPDGTWPTSTGTVTYTEPYTIKAGEVFDGKMQTFDRSDITCSEGEGQKDTAVFLVEAGGTLKNAIIGKNQKEGVHCDDHDCTIENVWWDDVCEDALSIKGGSASSVTTVTNCGARYASDKVVQHNGYGTVKIDGFYAQEFGKLYRSCGTCGDIPRKVFLSNVYAVDPLVSVITVNKNYGDQATLSNIWVKTSDSSNEVAVCQWSEGSGWIESKYKHCPCDFN